MHSVARRQINQRFLTDTCQIVDENQDTEGVYDPVTGVVTWPADTTVYTGRCSVKKRSRSLTTREGYGDLEEDEFLLRVPADTAGLDLDQVVTILTSTDPTLIGIEFEVKRVIVGTHSITRQAVLRRKDFYPSTGGDE